MVLEVPPLKIAKFAAVGTRLLRLRLHVGPGLPEYAFERRLYPLPTVYVNSLCAAAAFEICTRYGSYG